MSLLKRIGGTTSGTDTGALSGQRPNGLQRRDDALARGAKEQEDKTFIDLKIRVQNKLISELDPKLDLANTGRVRKEVEEVFNTVLDSESVVLSRVERIRMFESIAADIMGYGPLEELLAQDDITEIMVNGPRRIYVERKGKLEKSNIFFNGDEHVMRIIDRIVAPLGRRIDESSPMVDARLPNGSRVNAVIRPLALDGPALTIRKFRKEAFTIPDMIDFGTITEEMADFLGACVKSTLR